MTNSIPEINSVLQQYFDKVLVLTVPRFKERQEKVNERLKGIDFEFFYGTDKNDLDGSFISDNYVYDKKDTLIDLPQGVIRFLIPARPHAVPVACSVTGALRV